MPQRIHDALQDAPGLGTANGSHRTPGDNTQPYKSNRFSQSGLGDDQYATGATTSSETKASASKAVARPCQSH